MGNLVWTAITYFVTISIVLITFRSFVQDRKEDEETMTQQLAQRTAKANRNSGNSKQPAAAIRSGPRRYVSPAT